MCVFVYYLSIFILSTANSDMSSMSNVCMYRKFKENCVFFSQNTVAPPLALWSTTRDVYSWYSRLLLAGPAGHFLPTNSSTLPAREERHDRPFFFNTLDSYVFCKNNDNRKDHYRIIFCLQATDVIENICR